jgi:hypothetical protein
MLDPTGGIPNNEVYGARKINHYFLEQTIPRPKFSINIYKTDTSGKFYVLKLATCFEFRGPSSGE